MLRRNLLKSVAGSVAVFLSRFSFAEERKVVLPWPERPFTGFNDPPIVAGAEMIDRNVELCEIQLDNGSSEVVIGVVTKYRLPSGRIVKWCERTSVSKDFAMFHARKPTHRLPDDGGIYPILPIDD